MSINGQRKKVGAWHRCKVRTHFHRQHLVQVAKIQKRFRKVRTIILNPKTGDRRSQCKNKWKQIFRKDRRDSVIVRLYAFLPYHLCGVNKNTA